MFEIVRTSPGDNNFISFENFPNEIYPEDSIVFKVQESINYEYLEAGYLLILNNKVQCRAALYNNLHLRYMEKKTYCIGNYESVDDQVLSAELINYIASQAKTLGAEYLIGPMNGSSWDAYRFSMQHNHPNFFLEPYHHLYYKEHFSNSGFGVIAN